MTDGSFRGNTRCPVCGRHYQGQFPRYCLTCGWMFEDRSQPPQTIAAAPGAQPVQPAGPVPVTLPDGSQGAYHQPRPRPPVSRPRPARQPVVERVKNSRRALGVIAACLVLLLVAGGAFGLVTWLKSIKRPVPLPATAAAMRASVAQDEGYLNERGKALALGRNKNAPIYSVSAKLDTVANSVSGTERLLYTNNTGVALSEIVLHLYANSDVVKGDGLDASVTGAQIDGHQATATLSHSLVTVTLPAPLGPGNAAMVSLDFKEFVPLVQSGLGSMEQLLGQESSTGYGVFGRSGTTYDLGYLMPIATTCGAQG